MNNVIAGTSDSSLGSSNGPAVACASKRRILIIDDTIEIHDDFKKILKGSDDALDLAHAYAAVFGEAESPEADVTFEVDSALQGEEGFHKVQEARRLGQPYALAFVDMRMPPGWDGLETIEHLLQEDPDLQIVICTAYSTYTWEDFRKRLGTSDRVLILKKPFDMIEVRQLASSLTEKWHLKRQSQLKHDELEAIVHQRTRELDRERERLSAIFEASPASPRAWPASPPRR